MNLLKYEKLIIYSVVTTIIVGVITIFGVIIIYNLKGHINSNDIDSSLFGAFGDFVGGFIGTLFTISATLLILLTYYSQKEELKATNRLAEIQSQTQKKQTFESTFFNMLTFLERTRSVIEISKSQKYLFSDFTKEDFVSKGMESFSTYYKYLCKELREMKSQYPDREGNNIYNSIRRSLDTLNIKFYFDQINLIYQYLDSQPELADRFYYSVLYSQFSKYEKLVLFYVGISKIYPTIFNALKDRKEFENFEFINELFNPDHIEYYGLKDLRFQA